MVMVVRLRARASRVLLDGPLGLVVERAGGLVEDEDGRVAQQRTGDRQPLLLAAGEPVAAGADDRVVALGQASDQVVDPRLAAGVLDLGVGGVGSGVAQVVADAGVHQVGLLGHHADEVGEVGGGDVADVDAVDPARRPAVASCRRATSDGQRRLAAAGLADEREGGAGGHDEVDVGEHRPVGVVAEADVLEPHLAAGAARARRDGVVGSARSTGRSAYSKIREKSAIEAVMSTPTLSRPISGRNRVPWRAMKATRVPMVMPPEVAGRPAAR